LGQREHNLRRVHGVVRCRDRPGAADQQLLVPLRHFRCLRVFHRGQLLFDVHHTGGIDHSRSVHQRLRPAAAGARSRQLDRTASGRQVWVKLNGRV
jgi:hypothetical protein